MSPVIFHTNYHLIMSTWLYSSYCFGIDKFFTRPGPNIMLPKLDFPIYGPCVGLRNLEGFYFDLLPKNGWDVNLDAVEALTDHNTKEIVIINPENPCGNVYNHQRLEKVGNRFRYWFHFSDHIRTFDFICVST